MIMVFVVDLIIIMQSMVIVNIIVEDVKEVGLNDGTTCSVVVVVHCNEGGTGRAREAGGFVVELVKENQVLEVDYDVGPLC